MVLFNEKSTEQFRVMRLAFDLFIFCVHKHLTGKVTQHNLDENKFCIPVCINRKTQFNLTSTCFVKVA